MTTRAEQQHEQVVLLSADGRPVGTARKATVHHGATPLHLAFSCYLFDSRGRLLVTRRSLAKRTWPGVWSNSCCGHPAPGEPVEAAVRRRVTDELGMAVTEMVCSLPDFRYRAIDASGVVENEVCPVYVGRVSGEPVVDPAEVAEWRWSSWEAFVRIARDAPWAISPWAALQAPLLDASLDGDSDRSLGSRAQGEG
jgi:isopentenyl-diphosphate delta-isomerase